MRIGLIADVHANLQAFEAVLADAQARKVEMIWNMGDLVGYGPNPEEVVQTNQRSFLLSILGNYDRKVLRLQESQKIKTKTLLKRFAFQWAFEQLSFQSRLYLRTLPETLQLRFANQNIMLVHGSPESRDEHLTPYTPTDRLEELAKTSFAHIIICGHSHQAFMRKINNTYFINPGSVGRQVDGDYRASYAILEFTRSEIRVEHHRLHYNIEKTLAEMRKNNFPVEFQRMFSEGKDLDTILAENKPM